LPAETIESKGIVRVVPGEVSGVAFTSRLGGYSTGPYRSLNLSGFSKDNPDLVTNNRSAVADALGISADWITTKQVHGTTVLSARAAALATANPDEADAIVGLGPGRPIAVMTADCLPIALKSEAAYGAIHAGWRGLCSGIIDSAVASLRNSQSHPKARDLRAWIGPSIGPCHFEVGPEVELAFSERYPQAPRFGVKVGGADHFNLWAAARWVLINLGVNVGEEDPACTYCQRAMYFSYRRDGITGRQALLVWEDENSLRKPNPAS